METVEPRESGMYYICQSCLENCQLVPAYAVVQFWTVSALALLLDVLIIFLSTIYTYVSHHLSIAKSLTHIPTERTHIKTCII